MLPPDLHAETFFGNQVKLSLQKRLEETTASCLAKMSKEEKNNIDWANWYPGEMSAKNRYNRNSAGTSTFDKIISPAPAVSSSVPEDVEAAVEQAKDPPPADPQVDPVPTNMNINLRFAVRYQAVNRETAGALPTPFDCNLGWSLGHAAGALLANRLTGYVAACANLTSDVGNWRPCGIPMERLIEFDQAAARSSAARNPEGLEGKEQFLRLVPQATDSLVTGFGTPGSVTRETLRNLYKNRFEPLWRDHNLFKSPGPLQFQGSEECVVHGELPFLLLAETMGVEELANRIQPDDVLESGPLGYGGTSCSTTDSSVSYTTGYCLVPAVPDGGLFSDGATVGEKTASGPLLQTAASGTEEDLLFQKAAGSEMLHGARTTSAEEDTTSAPAQLAVGQALTVQEFVSAERGRTSDIINSFRQQHNLYQCGTTITVRSFGCLSALEKERIKYVPMLPDVVKQPMLVVEESITARMSFEVAEVFPRTAQLHSLVITPVKRPLAYDEEEEPLLAKADPDEIAVLVGAGEKNLSRKETSYESMHTTFAATSAGARTATLHGGRDEGGGGVQEEDARGGRNSKNKKQQLRVHASTASGINMNFVGQVSGAPRRPAPASLGDSALASPSFFGALMTPEGEGGRAAMPLAAVPALLVPGRIGRGSSAPGSPVAAPGIVARMGEESRPGVLNLVERINTKRDDAVDAAGEAFHRRREDVGRSRDFFAKSASSTTESANHPPILNSQMATAGKAPATMTNKTKAVSSVADQHFPLMTHENTAGLEAMREYGGGFDSPSQHMADPYKINLEEVDHINDTSELHEHQSFTETPSMSVSGRVNVLSNVGEILSDAGALEEPVEAFRVLSQLVKGPGVGSLGDFQPQPLRVGVVFGSHQAPGFHTVVAGLHDYLQTVANIRSTYPTSTNTSSTPPGPAILLGFVGGWLGLQKGWVRVLDAERIKPVRNLGGQEILCEFGTKNLHGDKEFAEALQTIRRLALDALVVVGQLSCQLDTALLALRRETSHRDAITQSVGFDTATKVFASIVGSLWCEAATSRKQWFFVRVKGESQALSHSTLETALLCHPNLVLLSEEIARKKFSLSDLCNLICDVVVARAKRGLHFGIVLLPASLLLAVPQTRQLILEIEDVLATRMEGSSAGAGSSSEHQRLHNSTVGPPNPLHNSTRTSSSSDVFSSKDVQSHLKTWSGTLFRTFPRSVQEELCSNTTKAGTVDLANVSTEILLSTLVKIELERRQSLGLFDGVFESVTHTLAYQARSGMPTNFDCNLAYTLGYAAGILLDAGNSGYLVHAGNLTDSARNWTVGGIPFTSMVCRATEGGTMGDTSGRKIMRHQVYMPSANQRGQIYGELLSSRNMPPPIERSYINAGPVQFAYDFVSRMLLTAQRAPFEKLHEVERLCAELQRVGAKNGEKGVAIVLETLQGAVRLLRNLDQSAVGSGSWEKMLNAGPLKNPAYRRKSVAEHQVVPGAAAKMMVPGGVGGGPPGGLGLGGPSGLISVPNTGGLADSLLNISPEKLALLAQLLAK
eukprot:g9191.t1